MTGGGAAAGLGRLDRALLGVLVPLWLGCAALHAVDVLRGGPVRPGFWIAGPEEPGGLPRIRAFERDPTAQHQRARAGLAVGDRLVRAGDASLRGLNPLRTWARMLAAAGPERRVALVVERDGARRSVLWPLSRGLPMPWRELFLAAGFALPGVLVLLRRPGAPEARALFAACLSFSFGQLLFPGGPVAQTYAWVAVQTTALSLAVPFFLRFALLLPAEVAPRARAVWLVPWLFLPVGVLHRSLINGWPLPPDVGARGFGLAAALAILAVWIAVGRNFRRAGPGGRRQIKWLVLGFALALLPVLVAGALTALEPGYLRWIFVASLATVGLPVCLFLGIARDRLLDVDRLLSGTASYTLLLVVALAVLLVLAPGLAARVAGWLGTEPGPVQIALAVALAAALVPLNGRLQPRVEGWFFPERLALREGFRGLAEELAACAGAEPVAQHVGRRSAELLRVSSYAVYVRRGAGFALCGVGAESGRVARREPVGPLLERLAASGAPRLLDDGAELWIPLRCDDRLEAFVALGPKRSGDRYGPTELAVLGGVAEGASGRLQRLRDAERLELERARAAGLRREKERAEAESLAKSRFLATASHDLRQPLHALGLFVEALEQRVVDGEAALLAQRIRRASDGLRELLDAILDLSRLDAGVVEPAPRDLPLEPLFERLEAELAGQAAAKGLALRVAAGGLAVRSDPQLLARILRNLLNNAMRYTESGRIELLAVRDGARVRVSVRDTGPGIPPEAQREIFRELVRLEPRAGGEGLGLGLSIVERLARLLGHEIALDSAPGAGSTFTLTLDAGDIARAASPAPPAPGDLGGACVLLVEADAAVREATRGLLESWGARVVEAAGVAEALRVASDSNTILDLVVSDLRPAGGSGLELAGALRRRGAATLPVLLLSADTAPETLRHVREAGHLLLPKPVSPMRLRAGLRAVLDASPTAERGGL